MGKFILSVYVLVLILVCFYRVLFLNDNIIIDNIKILKGPNKYDKSKIIELKINKKNHKDIKKIMIYLKKINSLVGNNIEFISNRYNHICFNYEYLDVSIEIINKLFQLSDSNINDLKIKILREKLGPSTESIIKAAIKNNIPWERLNNDESLVLLGHGNRQKKIIASCTSETKNSAEFICKDKNLTKIHLLSMGIPCPKGFIITNENDLKKNYDKINKPIVIKPIDGNHGNNVFINIDNYNDALKFFNIIKKSGSNALIEELFIGNDYRILIINYKFVAASKRIPAYIIGDGINTIKKLINIENKNPDRGSGHSANLTEIIIDDDMIKYINEQGYNLKTILKDGQIIYLRKNANISTGGIAKNVTNIIHKSIINMCENIAIQIGLDICGIDLICKDISKELINNNEGIIEVNSGPGLRMHQFPSIGLPIDVGYEIIKYIKPDRIPIFSITGTNGKTTTTNIIAHIMQSKYIVGKINTNGIYINNDIIDHCDCTGFHSAKKIIKNPTIECCVFETARGGIIKNGLGYDEADIGILTNIRNGDHIGKYFEEKTIDDIVDVKIIVLKYVKTNGWIVMNANDPVTINIFDKYIGKNKLIYDKNIILFSINKDDSLIVDFLNKNLPVVYYVSETNKIIYKNNNIHYSFNCYEIPSLEDKVIFQIENIMASIAACISFTNNYDFVNDSLKTYNNNDINNPGRFNNFKYGNSNIIIDYGHNIDAISYINEHVISLNKNLKIASWSPIGDRDDDININIAQKIINTYDIILIYIDDNLLRGRNKKNMMSLIKNNIKINQKTILFFDNELESINVGLKYIDKKNNNIFVIFVGDENGIINYVKNFIK